MQASIGLSLRRAALALAWALTCPLAVAQGAAPAAAGSATPPAGYQLPADPKPDENNAARSKTQPGNNAPFWRGVKESGTVQGFTSLPGAEKGTLIQPFVDYPGSTFTTAGEAWRQVRNDFIIPYGGALLLIALLALAIFYWRKGPLGGHHQDGPPVIERFTPLERAAHWTNASAFVLLAISGIVMAFGKFFLLPVLGATLFGWLTYALKTLHNFVGPLFAVSLVIVLATFVKDNIASAADFTWLMRAGGMLGDGHEVPSHRFNAGEKGIFWWGMAIPGLLVVASGLVLDKLIPGLGDSRSEMQIGHMVHAAGAMLMMTALLGHIYMGTIGVKGALRAMKTGWVDEGWAREHHVLWYEDVKAGKIPARRSQMQAPAAQAAAGQSAAQA
jgi:formate dehydrogenase subunit gamma